MAHGGGVRFTTDSEPYKLLRQWIEQGAPWGEENAPRAVKLEVSPAEQIVTGKAEFPLKVVAHYSDGTQRDVTATARYDSQQPMMLDAATNGLVKTSGQVGEGYIMIRYGDLVATSRFTQPYGPALPTTPTFFQPKTFIDEPFANGRSPHRSQPACSDDEFLRLCLTSWGHCRLRRRF
jgi:hypothetical protein